MTDTTALAVREFSDTHIRTRLEVAKGFGWKGANREQLNGAYLIAVKYDLDPLTDLTLYRDQILYTIDGRVRMMRRHPQYLGYETRPLTKDEKEAWGYGADEIVVECAIRTKDWGTIKARGKVRPAEFAAQPVARSHPQEMAEKRAIARASRMAFGTDVPDESEVAVIIQERDDPAKIAADSARYAEIFPPNYGEDTSNTEGSGELTPAPAVVESAPATGSAGAPDTRERPMIAADSPTRAELWAEHRRLQNKASELGLSTRTLSNRVSDEEIASANGGLAEEVRNAEAALTSEPEQAEAPF